MSVWRKNGYWCICRRYGPALHVHAPGCMLVCVCSFSESAPCACNDAGWGLVGCG